MQGFEAFWREARRVLASAAAEPLVLWIAIALLVSLLAGSALLRRRAASRNEVEHLFLAAGAALRKEREIAEMETFVRKAAAGAEELKTRLRKMRSSHYQQVRIYIDHSNFIRTWTQMVHGRERPLQHDVDWAELPRLLLEETSDWLENMRKSPQALLYRGTCVYGTLFHEDYFALLEHMLRLEQSSPDKLPVQLRLRNETVDRWREENELHKTELTRTIQRQMGYTMVPIYRRTPRTDQLQGCQFTSGGIPIAPEKMLDTHIATDLIGDATFDVYDIALLLTEDSDFVPAVEFVQDMRGKMVVHVGFGGHNNDLRSKCRYRIDLNKGQLFRRMQRGRAEADAGAAKGGAGASGAAPRSGQA